MTTLKNWLRRNEYVLSPGDQKFLAESMSEDGRIAEHPTADWSMFIGNGFLVEDTIQGTRIVDDCRRFGVTTWPGRVDIRDLSPSGDSGMSPEELAAYIQGLDGALVLSIYDE